MADLPSGSRGRHSGAEAVPGKRYLRRRSGRLAADSVRSSFDRSSRGSSVQQQVPSSMPVGEGERKQAAGTSFGPEESGSSMGSARVPLAGSSSASANAARAGRRLVPRGNRKFWQSDEDALAPPRWAVDVLLDCATLQERSGGGDIRGLSRASARDGVMQDCTTVLLSIGGPLVVQAMRDAVVAMSSVVLPVA